MKIYEAKLSSEELDTVVSIAKKTYKGSAPYGYDLRISQKLSSWERHLSGINSEYPVARELGKSFEDLVSYRDGTPDDGRDLVIKSGSISTKSAPIKNILDREERVFSLHRPMKADIGILCTLLLPLPSEIVWINGFFWKTDIPVPPKQKYLVATGMTDCVFSQDMRPFQELIDLERSK